MNDVALTGRLTRNPIIYENEDPKKQAAHFFLAVKKLGKRQEGEDTSFIPCVVFGKRGEHIHKGMLIGITGWIETSRREKEDGTMEYPWEVIVREMDFLEPKKNSENQNSTDGYNNYQEGQNNYQSGNNQNSNYSGNQNNYKKQSNGNDNNRSNNNNRESGRNRNGNTSRGNRGNSSSGQRSQNPYNGENQGSGRNAAPVNQNGSQHNQQNRQNNSSRTQNSNDYNPNYDPNYDPNYPMEQKNQNDNPYQDYNDNPYATAYDDRYNSGNQSAFDGNDQFNQGM